MFFNCIGSTWSTVVWQYVKCCRYCPMWLQDLQQMPVTATSFLCASIWNINGLLTRTVLFMLSFFLHSLSHCKSSPLILNPLHLNYSYSMNNSILIQHLAKCVCVCSLFERQPPLYLLVPFRCHLKKNKAKKAGREKGSIRFLFFKLRIFFIISDKFD